MERKNQLLVLFLTADVVITIAVIAVYPSASGDLNREEEGHLFTFAHITDSQFSGSSEIFGKTTSWLAQQDSISFVVHTGDIVNNPFDETAWKNAYQYMHQLDNTSSWAIIAGDNDVVFRKQAYAANFEKHFGSNSLGQHFIVENRLLFVLLGWNNVDGSIAQDRLAWMNQIIQEHRELNVIVCLHPYLSGFPFLNIMRAPNADEVWTHIDKHENVIMTLSGHTHQNWIHIHTNGNTKVWSISTEALIERGYIRLFDVYEDRIEVHAYSPWTDKTLRGPLDRFTIQLNPHSSDADEDLWRDDSDIMPTHPLVPDMILTSAATTIAITAYWLKARLKSVIRPQPL